MKPTRRTLLLSLQTRQPPIQSEKYQCRIDTVVLLMMGTKLLETCREVYVNILRIIVDLVGFILKRLNKDARSKKHTILLLL